jgi:dTDP-4-dehydrorhamnose reductase
MRVLVLGAGGQLGSELVRAATAGGDEVISARHSDIDITDGARLRDVIRADRPGVVFNAAAYTAVDGAETDTRRAELINGRAVARLAQVCRDLVVPVVHFSTDYVFDGSAREPIPEDAPTGPVSAYGRTKLLGEQALLRSGADAYLVRTSWVYGHNGANFVKTVLRVTRDKGSMSVVDDQRGSPTWARDLAVASRRLVAAGPPGLYHLTNSGDCTWHEFARAITELAGVDAEIRPITTADYPTPATRPAYSVLANRRWQELGEPPLRHWKEALAEFIPKLLGAPTGSGCG